MVRIAMIAAVTTVRNEADIIGCTVRHMLSQGVDWVYAMDWLSVDGTREILAEIPHVTVVDARPPFYWAHTPDYIGQLSEMAGEAGADWVIPFDADEYWTGTSNGLGSYRTVAEALNTTTADVVHAKIYQYPDFDFRSNRPYSWVKAAYRYRPGRRVVAGNHFVLNGTGTPDCDALVVHELKFRGFDHFVNKVQRRIPWTPDSMTMPDADSPKLAIAGEIHLSADSTLAELRDVWNNWLMQEVEFCSIPSRYRP